ncbi:3843_t:CDS:2 [Gigaspora margarita]|uniref:3843_t:CDS:1 n=1 Tax=Gigaspora margarita TaxID=4874 RepID=A0ABN7VTF5_GIGMA|nr:3843_t:CDS:2 [Gigaspora margarita]
MTKCHDQNNSEVSESIYPDNLPKAEISAKSSSEAQVCILPINKNASLNSRLPISILLDDPEEKQNFVIKIADFRPIMFEAKPDSELIIKSVLEHFIYLRFRNSFRGIDNYSFASPQPWSLPCPICNRKHGSYGLHGEWYCKNGNQLPYDPELAKLYFQDKLQYCLTCNTSSNKFKFAIVAT